MSGLLLIDQRRPYRRPLRSGPRVVPPLPRVNRDIPDRIAEMQRLSREIGLRKPLLTMVWMMRELVGSPGVRIRPKRAPRAKP